MAALLGALIALTVPDAGRRLLADAAHRRPPTLAFAIERPG
jgi:hypothetical protein